MSSIKEITAMCKNGLVHEAYELAKKDMEQQYTWAQREMGWVLYYLIKGDTEAANYQSLLAHIDELKTLNQLVIPDDNMIFENVLFKVADFVKTHISPMSIDSPAKLSTLFSKLKDYNFNPSKGYSFLLQSFIKCDKWQEMIDFLDWWNLDKLTPEDYIPFKLDNGKTIISVAERAFIAQSKALLRLNNLGRIEEFLPKMDDLIRNHPEMTYPGYFYGKMLLSLGSTQEEALRVILPFARKKITEFWVWQLLSDVFTNNPQTQLACLLRAVNCKTQEIFLGKVRIKLATLYIQNKQLDYAKHQIEKVTQCYLAQGWRLPYEVECWIHQSWINSVTPNRNTPIDYMAITNEVLCVGTEEAFAIVTYFDKNSHKATLVYGYEKQTFQRLRINVELGVVLKINYITEVNGNIRILSARQTCFSMPLDYAKEVEGFIRKRSDKDFAFLKTKGADYYIASHFVKKYNLQNNEFVKSLVVYDYNKRREDWGWVCVSITKNY